MNASLAEPLLEFWIEGGKTFTKKNKIQSFLNKIFITLEPQSSRDAKLPPHPFSMKGDVGAP